MDPNDKAAQAQKALDAKAAKEAAAAAAAPVEVKRKWKSKPGKARAVKPENAPEVKPGLRKSQDKVVVMDGMTAKSHKQERSERKQERKSQRSQQGTAKKSKPEAE